MRSVHIHNAIYLLSVTSNLSFKSAEYMHRELRGWRGGGGGGGGNFGLRNHFVHFGQVPIYLCSFWLL